MRRIPTWYVILLLIAGIVLNLSCTKNSPTEPEPTPGFRILAITPADGSIGVSRWPEIVLRFSEPLSPATVTSHTIFLEPAAASTVEYQAGSDSVVLHVSDSLEFDTVYKLHVSDRISSVRGYHLTAEVLISLRTVLPNDFVAAVLPPDSQIGVSTTSPLTIIFAVPMDPTSLNDGTITISPPASFDVTYTPAMRMAVIAPRVALNLSTDYTVTLTSGVRSESGNYLPEPFVWRFRTKAERFEVEMVSPAPGDTSASVYGPIRLEFSSPIDLASVTPRSVYITPPTPYTYSYDPNTAILSLEPTYRLSPGSAYEVQVTRDVRAEDSDRLETNALFSFTTQPVRGLYVAPGGTGDGSAEDPMNSLQRAVDSVAADLSLTTVFVAVGDYPGLVHIDGSVEVVGCLDPQQGWLRSVTDSTVLGGGQYAGNGIGLVIAADNAALSLSDLIIVAPDADSSGAGSYGIVKSGSASVVLSHCSIRAGAGRAGSNGTAGRDGDPAQGYTGMEYLGGLLPSPGSNGGYGGSGESADGTRPATPGGPGHCPDGSEGGAPGSPGASGVDGNNGQGGTNELSLELVDGLLLLRSADGSAGENGAGGCSGGGGSGSPRVWDFSHVTGEGAWHDGCWGDPGGGGGAGGGGGWAGQAGGCSIGIILTAGSILLDNSTINAGQAGDGGGGGRGGVGGAGGICVGNCMSDDGPGNAGGAGGDGGRGGHGGAGAGGWSIGIARNAGSTITGATPTITLGTAGIGGGGVGNAGANGQAVAVHVAP